MSLSGGTAGGKGVDSNAVDTYDSGDEWDIGVGNLIIDLDADLEKDKLEMSGTKDGGGLSAPPSAVAALPDNIRFVSPVPGPQGKESKSKSKRSKNSKDNSGKASAGDGAKKEALTRTQGEQTNTAASSGAASNNSTTGKGIEKGGKVSRNVPSGKKDKEGASGKSKKEKNEVMPVVAIAAAEKEVVSQVQVVLGGNRGATFENAQSTDLVGADQLGNIALESGMVPALTIKTEPEELDNSECRTLKKVKNEKTESPVSTPAPPSLQHLAAVGNGSGDIASPCEQIMVRTRSVASNTSDVALATEPDCLGPCEPGTSVNLEGIVWQETEDGMLVVNVTWRNKTYVGTLLDCTRHDWAPPRFCESPTSDLEMRNGRGRGKRMRPNGNAPVNENSNSSDNKGSGTSKTRAASNNGKGRRGSQTSSERRTPPNGNTEDVKASPSSSSKRKTKPASDMEPNSSSEDTRGNKRMRTNSNSCSVLPPVLPPVPPVKTEPQPPALDRDCPSPVLIDCPHPGCNKKYKHVNGLKYHQARAHNDSDIKLDPDGDSEYGEDHAPHPDPGCNGASGSQKGCPSPARSVTPKGRGFDRQSPSPSPGKFSHKQGKKRGGDGDPEASGPPMEGCDNGHVSDCSNDGTEKTKYDRKSKSEKLSQKKASSRPAPAGGTPSQQLYSLQGASFPVGGNPNTSPGMPPMMQGVPKSPQVKSVQPPKPPTMGEPVVLNPASGPSKEKKKKEKKKKDCGKEADSPKPPGKGGKSEEGKSPYSESSDPGKGDGLLNGSSDPHQSRLASIKAEADKIYSFTDNAPSPSIGVASRLDGTGMPQPLTGLHVVTQNGATAADSSSVKTNSPAYSDISDAGEDGEGKLAEGVKVKVEEQVVREGTKKALFPNQAPKEPPYYAGYEAYYSPNYTNPSPGGANPGMAHPEGPAVKVKREDEQERVDDKIKVEPQEERKPEINASSQQQQQQQQQQHQQHQQQQHQQQQSVIQQRSNMYMQPLYYNQYAYVPPYAYHPDQAYHNHLLNTNPAYRQQYEERQRQAISEQHRAAAAEKKSSEAAATKEEWKHKAPGPSAVAKGPGQPDSLGHKNQQNQGKSRDSPLEPSKTSTAGLKGEDSKSQQAEGLKMKLSEAGHHVKEDSKPSLDSRAGMEQAMWYRQQTQQQEEELQQQPPPRWKEERDRERERERKGKDDRPGRPKDVSGPKEDSAGPKEGADARTASAEEHRAAGKDPRAGSHMQFSSPLVQHQGYLPYMHGYPYGQGYDPSHPGYRGMPTVMMQNFQGSPYLPAGYPFSPYGGKMAGGEEEAAARGGDKSRASPTVSGKAASADSKALDILQRHAGQYQSKSPTVGDKPPHERERGERGGERERDRDVDRPRSSPSQRILPSHHHLGYPLLSGQYDLSYATGLSSSAIVASQQATAPSLYPPARR